MNLEHMSRPELIHLAKAKKTLIVRESAERCEESLIEFLEAAWPNIDPAPFGANWHLDAIAEHLEAVSYGEIRNLIVNIPPRHAKTLLAGVAWNAWTWAKTPDPKFPLIGPQVKFMCLSYGDQLSIDTATTARRLIQSGWYQSRWGERVQLARDQEAKSKFDTLAGGTRISGSFGGSVLGRGGDIKIIDDPHKVKEAESEVVRRGVITEYDETIKSRVTDPKHSAEVIIMHRVHEEDLTGHLLADQDGDWVHLRLPAEFETRRRCVTVLGFHDPRKDEGELLWPARFSEAELAHYKKRPYLWAGQYQQEPVPRGGGIIKSEMWRPWSQPRYPQCQYVLASLDTAYTEKEENDASALTIWGTFADDEGVIRVILLYAWEGRLGLHDLVTLVGLMCSTEHRPDETLAKGLELFNKGNVPPATTLFRLNVDRLLIENKASGISVAQEMERLYSKGKFGVEFFDPRKWGDKVSRLTAVEPLFSDGLVYVPIDPKKKGQPIPWYPWSRRVVENVAAAPKTSKWDTPDSVSMALRYLREAGLLQREEEQQRDKFEQALYRRPLEPMYAG